MEANLEGCSSDLLGAANGVAELFFHSPDGSTIFGVGNLCQFVITAFAAVDVLCAVHVEGALASVDPNSVAGRQPGDSAELHVGLGAIGQLSEDVHVIRNADVHRISVLVFATVDVD